MAITRKLLLPIIIAINLIALGVILSSPTRYKVDFSSVMEIWGDVFRDVDRFGLALTALPVDREIEIGDEAIKRFPLMPRHPRQQYLSDLGASVAKTATRRRIPYRFHVVSWGEPNAFAIPGGHVLITTGMLDLIQSEAELAAILGHEIAHIDLKHCIENLQYEMFAERILGGQLSQIVGIAYRLAAVGFSELQEREADRSAIIFMADAGYSPLEAVSLYRRIAEKLGDEPKPRQRTKGPEGEVLRGIGEALKDYFATHPTTVSRMQDIEAIFDRNMSTWGGKTFYIGRSNYADRITRQADERRDEQIIFSTESSEFWSARGRVAAQIGNARDAATMLTKAIELGDDNLANRKIRAQAYADLKDYENAAKDVTQIVQLSKSRIETAREEAQSLIEAGDKSAAVAALLLALETYQHLIDTYGFWLSFPDANKNQISEAREKTAAELLEVQLEMGQLYRETGRPADALEIFRLVLRANELNMIAIEGGALARVSLGRMNEALTVLSGLIISHPNLPELYGIRAKVYRASGDSKKADREHARYIRFRDQNVPPLSDEDWADLEEFWDKKKDFKAYATTSDDQSRWYRTWGFEWPRTAAVRAIINCQRNARRTCKLYALGDRIVWSLSDEELEKAYDNYERDIRQKLINQINNLTSQIKRGQNYAYAMRGNLYVDLGELGKAISDYSSYLRYIPKSFDVTYRRGIAYYKDGQYGRALDDFSIAVNESSRQTFSDGVLWRGYAKLYTGDLDGALSDFEWWIRNKPSEAHKGTLGRAAVQIARKEASSALKDIETVIQAHPDSESRLIAAQYQNQACWNLLTFALPEAARPFCVKANDLVGMDPKHLDSLAFMHWQTGDLSKAKKALADAKYVDSSSPDERTRLKEYRALLATTFLLLKGYKVGMVKKTLDDEARAAIKTYQRDHGLPQTGMADDELLSHLTPLSFGSFRISELPDKLSSKQIKQECAKATLGDTVVINIGSGEQYRCNTDGKSVRRVAPPN